ncbi:MAG: delta-60 repeat domain-containing protein, partial [Flavobacteriales bacterium]
MKINRHFRTFFILFLTLLSIQTTTAQPGSTDLTFNPGNGANGDVQCVCSQSDNKTIVTGLFNDFNGSIVNYIVRLNEDGTIDGSFNTGSGFGGNGTLFSEATYSCAIQSDGKILVGGNFYSFNGTPTNRLVRLNSDGTIDASFNIGNGFDGSVRSISIQSDGKIIVGGWLLTANGNSSARLARLNSDGSYDPTFTIGSGFGSLVLATAIQLDGKILVGGQFTTFNGTSQNYIARLNSNGTIDPSFQVGTAFNNYVRAISIQSDGKILIGGDYTTYNGSTTNRIVRLNSNGSID